MTIRSKFFLLAGILLVLFGAVVGTLAFTQNLDHDQLEDISDYELPLSKLIAEYDVGTDGYELQVLRILRSTNLTPAEHAAAAAAAKQLADELRNVVATSNALVDKAIADATYNTDERIELARIAGVLKHLSPRLQEV